MNPLSLNRIGLYNRLYITDSFEYNLIVSFLLGSELFQLKFIYNGANGFL